MLLAFLILMGWSSAYAADGSVVDIRRNITLSETDPVYKDFYINMGAGSGLKKNMVVTAVRKINIRDASGANAVGEIFVPVGQLKIIAIFEKVAVAREYTLLSRDELPMLEQIGIMTGDAIEVKGSFIDNSKPKPRKTAEVEPPVTPTTEVAVAPAAPTAGPAPASVTPPTPAVAANSATAETQKLEKAAVSSNNTGHE
jgi:hypothetical protein